ncbi:MAG: hypothetical protein ACRDZM_15460 [Acidimicrobiia bacterium]
MLLKHEVLRGIESGDVDAVYRRWGQPRVKVGTKLRTAVGVVEIVSVAEVDPGSLTAADSRDAGYRSVPDLMAAAGNRGPRLYRVGVRHAGPDPRLTLRETVPDQAELARIQVMLDRLDERSRHGRWTREALSLIADNPGVRAEDLARSVGREKQQFKLGVRKLKELGLTVSLETGYRLSARGEAVTSRAP